MVPRNRGFWYFPFLHRLSLAVTKEMLFPELLWTVRFPSSSSHLCLHFASMRSVPEVLHLCLTPFTLSFCYPCRLMSFLNSFQPPPKVTFFYLSGPFPPLHDICFGVFLRRFFHLQFLFPHPDPFLRLTAIPRDGIRLCKGEAPRNLRLFATNR